MRVILIFLFISLLQINQKVDLAIAVRKFVNQKDMSVQCKRRVIPSVFLGKQVMDASSYVMQLSRLNIPYSCSLSVRAETGYNIILIIHLLSASTLQEACSQNEDQLIVYELGETFGGYWGHLPDTMMIKKARRNYTNKFYTIKTTQSTITERTHTYTEGTVKMLMKTFPATDKEPDYIRMEVPLVNVSGNLQLGGPLRHTYNSEEMFDFIYDVTPRSGSQYETTIMPLVQFSIRQQKGYGAKPRYELDYNVNDFTMDSSTKRRITTKKRNWFANRLYTLRKKKKYPFAKKDVPVSSKKLFTPWLATYYLTSNYIQTTIIPTLDPLYMTLPWKNVDDLIKTLNVTSASTRLENLTLRNILSNISDMQHNLSVYLIQNLSLFDNIHYTTAENKIKDSFFSNAAFTTKSLRTTLISPVIMQKYGSTTTLLEHETLRNIEEIISDNNITTLLLLKMNSTQLNTYDYDSNTDGVTNILATTMRNTPKLQNGTLVNHESWENVVQSAPVMAIILNKTNLNSKDFHSKTDLNKSTRPSKLRKKRNIQAVQIEKSRPRSITIKKNMVTEDESSNELSELQDLARLVELQDDEMQGRVALRYLRNYVGPVLFNICDFQEAEARQMFLFNASRIVIAVSNFTLNRMMLVLTPAVTLFDNASECPPAHLECQITGTRVCIDSLNACDGVPNCGSYDIYDEDRLLCGVAKGLQHNVYLAAFTFLAVLLTMLYTVHYWLKRCVPRVSEAFFVFSDTSENTLILDTIMRSPADIDDYSYKCVSGAFFDDISLPDYKEKVGETSIFRKIYKACCGFLFCKTKTGNKGQTDVIIANYDSHVAQPNKMFSFTELELRKYALVFKDEGVQTGDSIDRILEKNKGNESKLRKKQYAKDSLAKFKITDGQGTVKDKKYTDELNLIKMTREKKLTISQIARTSEQNPVKNERRNAISPEDEKEIKSTVYERSSYASLVSDKIPVTCEIHPEKPKKNDTSKRLRFDESPTLITSVGYEEDVVEASNSGRMDSRDKHDLSNTIIETENGCSGKDFMKFWSSKSKKQKK